MKKEDITRIDKCEYIVQCDCCGLHHTAITQPDTFPEYYTDVYFQCQCGEFLEFTFPVN